MLNNPSLLTHAYAALTPDLLLDAVESVGYHCDGRLLALNSYENRVYQVGLDDTPSNIIAKFYRPSRWTDAQILEEHSFAAMLAEAEIPVIAAIVTDRKSTRLNSSHSTLSRMPSSA